MMMCRHMGGRYLQVSDGFRFAGTHGQHLLKHGQAGGRLEVELLSHGFGTFFQELEYIGTLHAPLPRLCSMFKEEKSDSFLALDSFNFSTQLP
jgi:hypothetical protein